MSGMKLGASVILRNATFKGDLDLHASSIGQDVSIQNSSFLACSTSMGLTFLAVHTWVVQTRTFHQSK
jgi:hypothetical protein